MPAASTAMVMESAGTTGRAICTRSSPSASTMSAGGSHAGATWVKNWRCICSARSSTDRASLHIQLEMSRDLTGGRWRRNAANQARCKKRSWIRSLQVFLELSFFVGELALVIHRGRGTVQVAEADAAARNVVGRHLEAHAIAGDDADAPLAHLAARIGKYLRTVRELHTKLGVRQHLFYGAFHLDHLFLGHLRIIRLETPSDVTRRLDASGAKVCGNRSLPISRNARADSFSNSSQHPFPFQRRTSMNRK